MADLDSSEECCPEMSNEVELTQSSSFVVGECFKSFAEVEKRAQQYRVHMQVLFT